MFITNLFNALKGAIMKAKIKTWYENGKWTKAMVKNAVKTGVLTEEDYKEITGEAYGAK